MKKSMMIVIGIVATGLISCTRSAIEKNGSDVVIKIPTSNILQSNSSVSFIEKLVQKNNLNTLATSSSQNSTSTGFAGTHPLNCFAVLVSGPTEALKRNHCYKKATSAGSPVSFYTSGLSQIVGYGANIELNDLESGPDRVFRLIGVHSSNGQCGDLASNHDNFGNPYIVSEVGGVNLEPGTVSITMPMTFASDKFFDGCQGPDFPDDHNDDGVGGGAKKLAVEKNYFPANQIIESTCQSVDVVAQTDNGNFSSVTSQASFQLLMNGAAVTTYNSYEDCTSSSNAGAMILSASQSRKNVWFVSPSKTGAAIVAFDLAFTSNPDSLSSVPLANVAVRDSSEITFDITAPNRVLPGQCYPFSIEAKYMNGNIYYSHYAPTTVTASDAEIFSDSTCSTLATTVSFSTGKSLPAYFKTSSIAGTKIKLISAHAGFVTSEKNVDVGQGSTAVAKIEIQYNTQVSMNSCSRARVTFLNSEHTAVPLLSPITLNLPGSGTTTKYTDDAYCMTSNGGALTAAAGQSSTEFYFEPLVYGAASLDITSGSIITYQMNYFAKYQYKLAIINQGSAVVDSGQCVRFDIHTQYQNSSSAYLSGTNVSITAPFAMFSDSNCLNAIGSAHVPNGHYYTSVFFLADNAGTVANNFSIGGQGSLIQPGSADITVNPRPALQSSWGLGTYKIPAEYVLDMKFLGLPFTGLGPFTYSKTSGTGTLTGDSYASGSGSTATFTVTDSRAGTLNAATQTMARLFATDFLSGGLPGGYSFTRSSAGLYYNASGTLVSAASGTVRFDHNSDPVSGHTPIGLLIEPARMNHTVYSSNLNAGTWSKSFASVVTSASVTDPMGNSYSDSLEWVSPTYTNMAYASSQAIAPSVSTVYAGSVFVKKDTARFVGMKIHEYGASYGYSGVVIDLDNGNVVGMSDPWSGDISSNFGVQKLKNGWFRIWTNYTAKGGSGIQLYLYPAYHGGSTLSPQRDNTATGRTYFWGAQLEVGESVTSYIATSASSASRSADAVSANLAVVASAFASTSESTVRLEYAIPEGGMQSDGVLMKFCSSGCSGEHLTVSQSTNGMVNFSETSVSGSENQAFYTPAFSIQKGVNKLSVSLGNNTYSGFNWSFNNTYSTSANSYLSYHPAYTSGSFYLGSSNGGTNQSTLHLRKIEGWTHMLSVPALRSMTK